MRSAFAVVLFAAAPALAQPAARPDSPATTEFRQDMARMHRGMMVPYTNDTDRDFVQGMIPHHQGAIDMAQTELRYGHDPALKRLAQDIVDAQRKEIATMHDWLDQHPLGR